MFLGQLSLPKAASLYTVTQQEFFWGKKKQASLLQNLKEFSYISKLKL